MSKLLTEWYNKMSYQEKNNFIDWLLTVMTLLAGAIIAMWLFNGCAAASHNPVKLTRVAQEPQTQVGLVNVSTETNIAEIMGILAFLGVLVLVVGKMLYHWKNSMRGCYLSET